MPGAKNAEDLMPSVLLTRADNRPLELVDACSDWLFLAVAALSISALAVERTRTPELYDQVQDAFVIGVLALFFMGIGVRLYWTPHTEDKRRQDLL